MGIRALVLIVLFAVASGRADTIFPTATGTTWSYQMTQEFGRGIRPSDKSIQADADGKVRLPITITVTGSEKIDGTETHKFELSRQDAVQTIQFLQITDQGIFEIARGDGSGER